MLPITILIAIIASILFVNLLHSKKPYEYDCILTVPCVNGEINKEVYEILVLKDNITLLGDNQKEQLSINYSEIEDVKMIYNRNYICTNTKNMYPGYFVIDYNANGETKNLVFDATTAKAEAEMMTTKIRSRI